MPNFTDFLKNLFNSQAGQNARTPSFIPTETAQDLGQRFGGILKHPSTTFKENASVLPSAAALGQKPDIPLAQPAPNLSITPHLLNQRIGKDSVGAEYKQRRSEMGMAAPPEVVYDRPFGKERYDYATSGGTQDPNKRGWGELLKNVLTGFAAGAQGGDIGAGIGGAIAGGVTGAVNPAAGREMRFNQLRLPKLLQDQEYEQGQQMQQGKLAQITADILHKRAQERAVMDKGRLERDQFEFNKTRNKFGTPQMVLGADGQEHLVVYDTNDPTKTIDLGVAGTPHAQRKLAEYRAEQAEKLEAERIKARAAEGAANRGSRERIAGQADQTRRQVAVLNEGGRDARHEGRDNKSAGLYQKWAQLREKAMNRDQELSQEEVNATVNAMNDAAEQLRGDSRYEISGSGGWSYVKPRQGGAVQGGTKGEIDIEAYVKANEARGKSRQQTLDYLRSQGYPVPKS